MINEHPKCPHCGSVFSNVTFCPVGGPESVCSVCYVRRWPPAAVCWAVNYVRGGRTQHLRCRDRHEASRLACDLNAREPGIDAVANWSFPAEKGD